MSDILDEIMRSQKRGEGRGITSICSAHPWVLKAAMKETLKKTLRAPDKTALAAVPILGTFPGGEDAAGGGVLLIESTCNQVNQFGGYTGMSPKDFVAYVHGLAAENAFPLDRLILGGDHLGPSAWQKEPADTAMRKAADLVRDYVLAGYTKIHLDASMRLGDDDPSRPLEVEIVAQRAARLAQVAEDTLSSLAKVLEPSQGSGLHYVIGSEVPIPGGATTHEEGVHVTGVADARSTLELTQAAFLRLGLGSAWERVIALVVQPGVEFGDDFVLDYQPAKALHLKRFAETTPFVYEAHSTDYQTSASLEKLVQDHFAILKVGPALTFAFREAVFALAMLEEELLPRSQRSNLVEVVDKAMQRDPIYWQGHYHGTPDQIALARKYSLSDRIRYYWPDKQVQSALGRLLQNLSGKPLPLSLVSQFLPGQWEGLRSGRIANTPEALIFDKISSVLEEYALACG